MLFLDKYLHSNKFVYLSPKYPAKKYIENYNKKFQYKKMPNFKAQCSNLGNKKLKPNVDLKTCFVSMFTHCLTYEILIKPILKLNKFERP